ncbi:relaxase/mobilization nuclease domain-containing protein [Priestia filamentosa]|uniref:relaxase/mobilization nuclease domain-containing protein n=1 Tax=Priestia filamentosa TaxID=1402861 RepID=UPI00397ABD65
MATVKHSPSKKINRLINYCEKRAELTSSHLLIAEDRKSVQQQMKLTRELFNKNDGVEGHHFIQSFKPGEVTPEQANELGLELAKKMHPNREAIIYTHTDKDHIHNHIVLNSPDIEQGKKLSVTRKHYYDWQRANDRLCRERGLSIVEEKQKREKVTLPEYHLMAKGKMPYKEHLRQALDRAKEIATSLQELKIYVKEKFSIDSKMQKGKVYFKTPEMERFISGNRLGDNYTKEVLERELERNAKEYERRVQQLRDERKQRAILPDQREQQLQQSRLSTDDELASSRSKRNEQPNQSSERTSQRTREQVRRITEGTPKEPHANQQQLQSDASLHVEAREHNRTDEPRKTNVVQDINDASRTSNRFPKKTRKASRENDYGIER